MWYQCFLLSWLLKSISRICWSHLSSYGIAIIKYEMTIKYRVISDLLFYLLLVFSNIFLNFRIWMSGSGSCVDEKLLPQHIAHHYGDLVHKNFSGLVEKSSYSVILGHPREALIIVDDDELIISHHGTESVIGISFSTVYFVL